MNTKHTLAKILAVVSAMALASGYVAYRATGKLPWELHAAEGAGGVLPSSPQPPAYQSPTQVSRTTIMPSSKSYSGSTTTENAPVTIPASALRSPESGQRTTIMYGSKSGVLVAPSVPPSSLTSPPQEATVPTRADAQRTEIMSSSKSLILTPPTPPAQQQQPAAQAGR